MRPQLPLAILLLVAIPGTLPGQDSAGPLKAILRAEDDRAALPGELALLLRELSNPDPRVARRAMRALGRLERPLLIERLLPRLGDSVPALRGEAAQAVAQAAQGFRRAPSSAARGASWEQLLLALGDRVRRETDPATGGLLALSLARLPYLDGEEVGLAWLRLLELGRQGERAVSLGVARGSEMLARRTSRLATPPTDAVALLRSWADSGGDGEIRRAALSALLAAHRVPFELLQRALRAPDPELRRLAVTGIPEAADSVGRRALLASVLDDSDAMVRSEALRVWSRVALPADCPRVLGAARDTVPRVRLLALDLLGGVCGTTAEARQLLTAASGEPAWRPAAHALVSLARTAPQQASELLPRFLTASRWETRMYAARAAGVLRDTVVLDRLARDRIANVAEAALSALREVSGHRSDQLYRAALSRSDYQLVLTAASALAGTPEPVPAAAALLAALDRLTRERRETSRDTRVALLARLREVGGPTLAPALLPYLRDFDPVVCDSAAALLSAWTGASREPAPRRWAPEPVSLAEVERLRGSRLRFSMASGGSFEVALLLDDAPLTAVRVARMVRRGYFTGLGFHRVVPNFVIQGGSPGANEYAGATRLLRDELGPVSHARGTVGSSTRGRDTGDGQLFINLVDNPRLDYEYTVWGRVVSGMEVVDAVLEGDAIRRVEIIPGPVSENQPR